MCTIIEETIREHYWSAYKKAWAIYAKVDPIGATKRKYRKVIGKELDLTHPTTLTAKLQWLKLNDYRYNLIVRQCIDKYAVRQFVKGKGCPELLNELYGVWNSVDEIGWNGLPKKFVLKCNHGCGFNLICTNKDTFDIESAKTSLRNWMKTEYGFSTVELIYEGIQKRIICEKFIEPEHNGMLRDYKIFCSYGVPKLIYVISDRSGETENLDYYTPEWEWIPVRNGVLPNAGDVLPRPAKIGDMLSYASILSRDFPIVRVDFYCEYEKIIFGELTFLATGGLIRFDPESYDEYFGSLFPIHTIG